MPSASPPGYIADQPWQHTYQRLLSPQVIRFAMAMAGAEAPPLRTCCELAFGQGLSLAIHAACNAHTRWFGTDFNPGHVQFARTLAEAGRLTNVTILDQDLVTFCERQEAPGFDLVACVGTWSWLPFAERQAIAGLISRQISVGGLFCLDHCTLPGMNGMAGLHRILGALAGIDGTAESPIIEQVPGALRQASAFLDTNPTFGGLHWRLRGALDDLQTKNPSYVAHEFFNPNSRPEYLMDLADLLAQSGLEWRAPWSAVSGIDALHLSPRQASFLRSIADPVRREQLRDFTCNTGRRADIWSKGSHARQSNRAELLATFKVTIARPSRAFDLKVIGALGEIALSRALYGPLLEALNSLEPMSIGELHRKLGSEVEFDDVCEACAILLDRGMVLLVNDSTAEIEASVPGAWALNRAILAMALQGDGLGYLGSPVTGSGIAVSHLHQLFLLGMLEGERSADAMAQFARAALLDLTSDPTAATPRQRAGTDLSIVRREADAFIAQTLPILRGLRIAAPNF